MEVIWQPQEGPQTEFCRRNEFEVLYGGAKGGGKSEVLLMEGLRQINNPRYHAAFFRRTYPQLREMMDRAHQVFPKLGGVWRASDYRWTFPSGSRYDFRHLSLEDSKYDYQGQEFHYLAFDQLEQFTESMYDYMVMQVRTSDPTIRTYVRASANPGGIGHGWVSSRWILGKEPYKTYRREFGEGGPALTSCYIPAKIYDNKILLEANPLYLAQLQSLPEDLRRAMLDGDWSVFAGQYFNEFRVLVDNEPWHVIPPHEIPKDAKKFRSIDWGFNDPCCVLWHYIEDKRVVTYRELYVRQKLASEVAREIVRLSKGEDISYTVGSQDLRQERGVERRGVKGETLWESFRNNGVFILPADNRRVMGWTRVREYMATAPDGLPYWQCFSTCKNLIRTLPGLVYDSNNVEDVADGVEDHAPESLRYALMSRPRPNPELPSMYEDLTEEERVTVERNMEFAKVYSKLQERAHGW